MGTIFCFSSTGNSLYAAKHIATNIKAQLISMSDAYPTCDDDVIGFIFPVYYWGLPKTVEHFISQLTIKNKRAYVFAVFTYGLWALGIAGVLNKELKKKGVQL